MESAARGSSQIELTRPEIQTVSKCMALCGTTGGMSKETMPKRPKNHRAQDPSIQGPRTRNPKTHGLKLEGEEIKKTHDPITQRAKTTQNKKTE